MMDKSLSLFAMASEWMVNGNINEFINANENVDRFELVGRHSCLRPDPTLINPPDSSKTLQKD